MTARLSLASLFLLVWFPCAVCYGQEEEVLGKKRSEWLTILKTHQETKFRRAAVVVLGVIGPKAKGVLEGLIDAVENDRDPEVRREAVLTLGRMGADAKGAADVLGDVLKRDKEGSVREAAAVSLAGKLNDQAFTQVMALAGALKDSHAGTRAAAAEALNNLGEKAKIAIPHLNAVAKDPKADRFPRIYAIQIISKWGDEDSLGALVGIFDEKEVHSAIRLAAIEGIGRMGNKALPAIPLLARTLSDKDVDLRRASSKALFQLGERAQGAWPGIKEAYKDSDNAVRHQIIRVSGNLGREQKEAVALLTEAAQKDANLENRLAALQELGRLETAAKGALPILAQLAVEDVRASVREAAQAAMKRINGEP